jgi:hypothetical protein
MSKTKLITETIELEVSYSQLAVFSSGLSDPFNRWTDEHVAQGFSWRPGSVSFATLVEYGLHHVTVLILDSPPDLSPAAIRVLEVPFAVQIGGKTEIASISDAYTVVLPPGRYQLRCELLPPEAGDVSAVNLVFWLSNDPIFAISLADDRLSPHEPLLLTAEPG